MVLSIYSLHRRPGRSWKEGKLKGNISRQVEGGLYSRAEGSRQRISEVYLYGRLGGMYNSLRDKKRVITDTMKATKNSIFRRPNGILENHWK